MSALPALGRRAMPLRFSFPFDDMALPGIGAAEVQVDRFIVVPDASQILRAFVLFDQDVEFGGVMEVGLVQEDPDGTVFEVTTPIVLIESTRRPVAMEMAPGQVTPQDPIYLRIIATPDGSGLTPWWTTATAIHGTIHFDGGPADSQQQFAPV